MKFRGSVIFKTVQHQETNILESKFIPYMTGPIIRCYGHLGGLVVSVLDPRVAGSNPAEAMDF
jgi:hypothetical protein